MNATAQTLPPLPDTISTEARQSLQALEAASAAAPPPASIEEMRQQISQLQDAMGSMQRQRYDVTIERTTIAGVPAIVFRPAGGARSLGVLLNLHGGGFMLDSGSQTENIPLAALTGMTVVAVLYRLAPEHPFPAAVDDAFAVYRDLLRTTPADHIAIYGTSAGAVLSAQLMVRIRDTNTPSPAALGFFSGSADMAHTGDSEEILPKAMGQTLRQLAQPYVGATADTTPALSPIYADLSGFPPTLALSSTRDPLLSQTTLFHRALRRAGVDADLIVFEAMPHAFWSYIVAPESDEAFAAMAGFFRAKLNAVEQP
ncbi:MAG: alpha/beta hydrolase [Hyphomonadaceae bacterium]|nr:alpha/beta hydrolase [Hyphomonadaceae bacterium]